MSKHPGLLPRVSVNPAGTSRIRWYSMKDVLYENTISHENHFLNHYMLFGLKKKSVVNFLSKLTARNRLCLKNNQFKSEWRTEKSKFFQNRLRFVTCQWKGLCWGLVGLDGWNVIFDSRICGWLSPHEGTNQTADFFNVLSCSTDLSGFGFDDGEVGYARFHLGG